MPKRPKVLVAESREFPVPAAERLRGVADLVLADVERPALLGMLEDANVLWVRLRTQVDAEVFDAAPQLGTVVSPTTGLTHIDAGEAERRGIRVLSLRGETTFLTTVRATAEHTIGLVLALLRQIPAASRHAAGGHWNREAFKGRELHGMTVGVIGYGRLGRQVARYLSGFGAQVLVTDPAPPPSGGEDGITFVTLDQLLALAELVTVHANYQPSRPPILGKRELGAMRQGARLINTARGELVDESALLAALRSGRLAGAAIDVLADEQRVDLGSNPLLEYARCHDNLLVTPHIGGCTIESMDKTECFMAERLIAHLEGRTR